jgi:hypothetical protein
MRKKYTKYSSKLTPAHTQLLLRQMRHEWDRAERALKRHEVVQHAKRVGAGIGKLILAMGLAAGVLTIAVVAPNVCAAAGKMFGKSRTRFASLSHQELKRRLASGSSKRYWRYEKLDSDTYRVTLTKQGRSAALRARLRDFKLSPQPVWDGRWRLVMFDIPAERSAARDALRSKLSEVGMYALQKSVFVYPYACEDEIRMCAELFSVSDNIVVAHAQFGEPLHTELKNIFKVGIF